MRRPPPRAVLVMLSTETNRYKALINAGRKDDVETLMKDREFIHKFTIADFNNHFNFCPVYFFYDTELESVKNQQFAGVLFKADSTMAPTDAITDTNFLIVYYGFPTWQTGRNTMQVTSQSTVGGKPNGWGLVLNNHEMKQVGYTYWLRLPVRLKTSLKNFVYESKKFDLEYMPMASDLNSKLYVYSGQMAPVSKNVKSRKSKPNVYSN